MEMRDFWIKLANGAVIRWHKAEVVSEETPDPPGAITAPLFGSPLNSVTWGGVPSGIPLRLRSDAGSAEDLLASMNIPVREGDER